MLFEGGILMRKSKNHDDSPVNLSTVKHDDMMTKYFDERVPATFIRNEEFQVLTMPVSILIIACRPV